MIYASVVFLVVGNRHLEYRQDMGHLLKKQMQSLSIDSQQGKVLCVFPGSFEISLRYKLKGYKIKYKIVPRPKGKKFFKLAGIPEVRCYHQ